MDGRTVSATDTATPCDSAPMLAGRASRAALEAAWELDALLGLLLRDLGPGQVYASDEAAVDALRTRGLAMRMRTLTGVLMSAVGDITCDASMADSFEELVYGGGLREEEVIHG